MQNEPLKDQMIGARRQCSVENSPICNRDLRIEPDVTDKCGPCFPLPHMLILIP